MKQFAIVVGIVVLMLSHVALCAAADDKSPKAFLLAGKYELTALESWASRQPRNRIIECEFSVPPSKGDEQEGRVTVMGAGGSVEANIDRWYQQFSQPDGSSSKERAKIEKREIAGQQVTIVDLSGTYMDRPGPMAPGVERPNYRMLGAIIQTKNSGNHFVKFYGPQRTVTDHAEAFAKMLDGLRAK